MRTAVMKQFAKSNVRQKPSIIETLKRYKFHYFLLSPAMLYTFVFFYLPMLGIIIAFQEYDVIKGVTRSQFVGLKNFITVFSYPQFLFAIKNTLVYSSVILFAGFPLPIILALMFNELWGVKFKRVVQTISYLPYFISWISVIAMFYSFFSLNGTLNSFLSKLCGDGYQRFNILMDANYFLGILFGSHVWKNVGWSSVIFLAAISGVDPSLYEAATVDGCGRFKQTLHITLPSIAPTIIILFVLAMGSLVTSNFEQVFGLQNLYIQEQTEVINTLVYRQGVMNGKYSLSTAFGLSQGVVSFLLVYVSNIISKKLTGLGIW